METKRKGSHKSYGGCILAILQALDSTENIDEALEPWEENLSAKEHYPKRAVGLGKSSSDF